MKKIGFFLYLIGAASFCRADEAHLSNVAAAAQVFDGVAGARPLPLPLTISAANTAGEKPEISLGLKVPAKPQDKTPGWKKFMLNGEESSVVTGAAGWGMFAGVIGGVIIGWAANAWLGALLGFIGGGLAGAAIGAALGYLFVKIFA